MRALTQIFLVATLLLGSTMSFAADFKLYDQVQTRVDMGVQLIKGTIVDFDRSDVIIQPFPDQGAPATIYIRASLIEPLQKDLGQYAQVQTRIESVGRLIKGTVVGQDGEDLTVQTFQEYGTSMTVNLRTSQVEALQK